MGKCDCKEAKVILQLIEYMEKRPNETIIYLYLKYKVLKHFHMEMEDIRNGQILPPVEIYI